MVEPQKTPVKHAESPKTENKSASKADDASDVTMVDGPDSFGPAPKEGDVPDPRTADGKPFAGFAGRAGFDEDGGPVAGAVQKVDPDNIPADVTPDVQPNSGGDELLAAAQAKAPNLTAEFVAAYGLSDEDLAKIARGEVSPPPAIGPHHTSDLYLTPGGWVQTAPGVPLGVSTAISR